MRLFDCVLRYAVRRRTARQPSTEYGRFRLVVMALDRLDAAARAQVWFWYLAESPDAHITLGSGTRPAVPGTARLSGEVLVSEPEMPHVSVVESTARSRPPIPERVARDRSVRARVTETIVAAAVRYEGIVYSLPPPARHSDVFRLMVDLPGESTALDNQGFVTSVGRFVDRREAAVVARAALQLIREPTPTYLLTSEDVW